MKRLNRSTSATLFLTTAQRCTTTAHELLESVVKQLSNAAGQGAITVAYVQTSVVMGTIRTKARGGGTKGQGKAPKV